MLNCQLLAIREINNRLTLNHHEEVSVVVREMDPPFAVVGFDGAGNFHPAPVRGPVPLVGPSGIRPAKKEVSD